MQEELLLMSQRERARKAILEAVKQRYFSVKEASKRMNMTPSTSKKNIKTL